MTPIPAPNNPCATCGECCRKYIVPVFGYDVWRIVTEQRLGAEQFVVAYPQTKADQPDGFRLEPDGPAFGLMLDKRGPLQLKRPCVFLVDLAGGHSRCGIYNQRPVACQTYPMVFWSDVVAQRTDALCPPDSWPLGEVLRPGWRRAAHRLRMHLDVYGEVAARWNAHLAGVAPGRRFVLAEYLSYVVNVYDRLASLDGGAGEAVLAEVEASWPCPPRPALDLSGFDDPQAAPLWLQYFFRARGIIDGFYPDVPPLPPRLMATAPADLTPDGAGGFTPRPAKRKIDKRDVDPDGQSA